MFGLELELRGVLVAPSPVIAICIGYLIYLSFLKGPHRFVLQCVCKIERLFSVNVIRTSCLQVASCARIWAGTIVLVLACGLAPAAYASSESSSGAGGEPAVEMAADAPVSSEAVHPENGWEYDAASNQWLYYQNSAPAKGWLYTGGFWYWFDDEGVMAVGLTECGGRCYLLNAGDDASIPYGAMRLGGLRAMTAGASSTHRAQWSDAGCLTARIGTGSTLKPALWLRALRCAVRARIASTHRALWFSAGLMTAAPGIMPILPVSFRVGGCINGARGIGSTPQRRLWRRAW